MTKRHFQKLRKFIFDLIAARKLFSKMYHTKDFALLSKKIFSTSSHKHFQTSQKCHFQTLRNFDLKLSKVFSEMLPMTKFCVKQALPCYPGKWFQLCHSKICRKAKNIIFKHSGLLLPPQGSFKIIFENAP